MIRAIAFFGLLLASAGLWLAPETVSVMGENIEPIRYERAAAPPVSGVTVTTATGPACITTPAVYGSTAIPVYTACTATGNWSTPTTAVTTAVTGR